MSVNRVILEGYVGRDPDVRPSKTGGDKIANISLATTKRWKDSGGSRREATTWHRIVVFNGNLADIVGQYVHKGSRILVIGEIANRKYTGNDGVERWLTEVVLNSFGSQLVLLDRKEEGAPPAENEDDYANQTQPAATVRPTGSGRDDEEIPF